MPCCSLTEQEVLAKLLEIKQANGGSFALKTSDRHYNFVRCRLNDVRRHLGTERCKPVDLEQQEPFQSSCKWAFPVHKPIKAAKGTVTDGSKVSKYEYDKEFHRKKRQKKPENKARALS